MGRSAIRLCEAFFALTAFVTLANPSKGSSENHELRTFADFASELPEDGSCFRSVSMNLNTRWATPIPANGSCFPRSPLQFFNYSVDIGNVLVGIEENGALTQIYDDVRRSVSGSLLEGAYDLIGYNVQFSYDNDDGSTHAIKGKRFPVELQLVHYKSSYGDLLEASRSSDGFLVVSVLFQKTERDSRTIRRVVTQLRQCSGSKNCAVSESKVNLAKFLRDDFFAYVGPLQAPFCVASAYWVVFKRPFFISEEDLATLREIRTPDGGPIVQNYSSPVSVPNLDTTTIVYGRTDDSQDRCGELVA